jgi:hypothetical protein
MFSSVSSEREFLLEVVLIRKFTQPQQYAQTGFDKVRVCRFKENVKTQYVCI